MKSIRFRSIWAIACFLAAGCGGSPKPPAVDLNELRKTELEDLGQCLKDLVAQNKKPPAKLADLDSIEAYIPNAGPAIRNGDLLYIWGSAIVTGGKSIIAHEKKAPTEGGYVLLQDGSVIALTQAEFESKMKESKK